jgi:hypothetical protein
MSSWTVLFHTDFLPEFDELQTAVQDELLAKVGMLRVLGPTLKRPHADTLKGSKHKNMKELRFEAAGGVWRAAFAFDPVRRAIVLVAGDKSGGSSDQFYKQLIAKADERFDEHLRVMRRKKEEQ